MSFRNLMFFMGAAFACDASAQTSDDFLLVDLKCPSENNQTLETLQQNSIGWRERIRVIVDEAGAVTFAELAASEADGDFDAIAIAGKDLDDPEAAAYAEDLLERARIAGGRSCGGTAEEMRGQLKRIKRNRVALGIE